MLIIAIISCLLLGFLAYKNFTWAIGIFIIALPAYLIRLNIGSLPTTLLEMFFGVLLLVWLIKYGRLDYPRILQSAKNYRWFFILLGIFFLASIAGIFVSDMWYASLGQWRAYFLEPMLFFLILLGRQEKPRDLICFLALSTVSISIVAIIQKLTGALYPPSLWDDELFGRVTSFFTTPNAIGLYVAPVIMLSLTLVWPKKEEKFSKEKMALVGIVFLACLAVFVSFSQGAWVALAAGAVVLAYLLNYKKTAIALIIAGIVFALAVPQLRAAVLFQDKAGENRLTLWHHSITYFTASPKNFVFGAGIRQYFRKIEKPTYNAKEMERLIYPHNIFLNFWTEIGLFGTLAFTGMAVYCFYLGFKLKNRDNLLGSVIIASLIVFFVQGLVDVPYFKNDLAFLFWIIIALLF